MERIALSDNSGRWFDRDSAKEWCAAALLADDGTRVSLATGKSWEHETLYMTKTGFFVMNFADDRNPSLNQYVEWGEDEAVKWLLANGYIADVDQIYNRKRTDEFEV